MIKINYDVSSILKYTVFVVLTGLIATVSLHFSFVHVSENIDGKLLNKHNKILIAEKILTSLDEIEKEIYLIAISKNSSFAKIKKNHINETYFQIKECFEILNKGGEINIRINLNIVNNETYIDSITYIADDSKKYLLEEISILPKLEDIMLSLIELETLIINSESENTVGDIDIKIERMIKEIPPKFSRMREDTYRIVYECSLEEEEIQKKYSNERKYYRNLDSFITSLLVIVIIFTLYISNRFTNLSQKKLETLAYKAEQANIAKSNFIANTSHEIRTPLNAIVGFSELLTETALSAKGKNYSNIVLTSANDLLAIVNNILDLSKLQSSELELKEHKFSMCELLDHTLMLYDVKVKEKNITLCLEVDPKVPECIISDSMLIKQIISNLLSNAIKFSDIDSKIVLSVNVLELHENDVLIKISVKDTGIGIDKAMQKSIFNDFEQVESGVTRISGGTGLGLSIVKRLLKAFKSEIKLESEVGIGSNFSFEFLVNHAKSEGDNYTLRNEIICGVSKNTDLTNIRNRIIGYLDKFCAVVDDYLEFPNEKIDYIFLFSTDELNSEILEIRKLYPSTNIVYFGELENLSYDIKKEIDHFLSAPLYDSKFADLFECSTKRPYREYHKYIGQVLVAEDNPINQELIKSLLENFGLKVYLANNGEEALDLYKREVFQLIILDKHMPVMDGLETLVNIKELQMKEGYYICPIMTLTASVYNDDDEPYIAYGVTDNLKKPIDFKKLSLVLERVFLENESNLEVRKITKFNFDRAKLSNQMGLDDSVISGLIDMFLERVEEDIKNIDIAIESGTKNEVYKAAHYLKGAALNLGFDQAVKFLIDIEDVSKSNLHYDIDTQSLKDYFNKIKSDNKRK